MRGIERRCLERLLETVHVDENIWSAAGLRDKTADIARYRLDPIKTPIVKSGCSERETAVARRHKLRSCDGHRRSPLRPEPRLRPGAAHWLARGYDEQRRVDRERRSVVACTGSTQAGASAQRDDAG
ncbi:hypothetical protein BJA01nite_57290 [Bradyrhizobium japonicum]|nr:hypothetical protein BJ6T_71090 [Bradyrhizobium japonicum USDA 6]GEC48087.1 hypothetical protein BJA01nite_57290 [Bradyrhizobium japonicum]